MLPAGLYGGLAVVTANVPEVDVEFLRVAPEKLPAFIDMAGHYDSLVFDVDGR